MICSHRLHHFTISILFLFILTSTHLTFTSQARITGIPKERSEEILRAQIGSRPPKCERRCSSCGHCEAIQVPTNPQISSSGTKSSKNVLTSTISYSRGNNNIHNSNYKPMSWKCRCGQFIFNP